MKSFLALSILAASLLLGSATFAQSSEPASEEIMGEPALTSDDGPTDVVVAPAITIEPTPASPTPASAPDIRATVLKLDGTVCAVGTKPTAARTGCTVELLPNPSNPLPPLSQYDWSPGPISQIPSPVGAPIFSSFSRPVGNEDFIQFRLSPPSLVTYGYTCPQGQCSGSAQDVWRAMPPDQREQYLAAVIRAEQANQSWGPQRFLASVVALDAGQELGCAMMGAGDPTIRFGSSCAGPFGDHFDP